MKERLVELLRAIDKDATITCPRYSSESTLEDCKGCQYDKEDGSCDYAEREADHILADGWIRPPCKVGDILYSIDNCINRPEIIFVTAIHQYEKYISITALSRSQKEYVYEEKDFGKYVFLTREAAQAKLKEGGKE